MLSIVDITTAIAAELAGHQFGKLMVVERTYEPEHGLEELRTARLIVVPRSDKTSVATREADQSDYEIDIAIQAKLAKQGAELTTEIDGWMAVADQVKRFVNRLRPSTATGAKVVQVVNKPIYDWDHLRNSGVFTSVITATVRVVRAA
jgi:hypothetical protein